MVIERSKTTVNPSKLDMAAMLNIRDLADLAGMIISSWPSVTRG